jgi:hypothetical protein
MLSTRSLQSQERRFGQATMVSSALPRQLVKLRMVNRNAPELFPVLFILKEEYTQRKMRSAAPSK